MSILKFYREIIIVALLAVIAGGYLLWPQPDTAAGKDIKTKEEVDTKQTIITVVKRPDGTVEEKTVITEKETKVSTENSDKMSRYSVGAYANVRDVKDYRIDVAARLGNLPLHGVLGYEFKDKTIYAGIRAEF